MTEHIAGSLNRLREEPFKLLREMERMCRAAASGSRADGGDGEEWVGIGCKLANERLLISREDIREVMMLPAALTRVPGAKDWVAGLANLRGQILTVVDLRTFLGAGTSKGMRSARVLVVDSAEIPVGIIVDEVFGFRRFGEGEITKEAPETSLRCERYLAGACTRGAEVWPILSLTKLLAASEFQKASA
jgi:twitching motility protein PilI